ncbi:MAG: response regulator [Lentisphaeria bacterium]|nr:response regulator [Lentisphaeria bacterium]
MEPNKDALKQAALQNNSEECNALRSLLLGLCQQCSVSMQRANSYHELIFDELEARRGNTEYVDKVGHELSTMHSLIVQILQELPPTEGERMNLAHLVTGVLDRYRKGILDERTIQQELDESAIVSADAFEIQELLLNLLEGLDRLNQPVPPAWKVTATTRNFNRQEASTLRLKDGGAYCILTIRPDDAPELDIKKFRPFSLCLEESTQIPAIVVAQWCGSAAHNNAHLFFDDDYPLQSAAIILPQASADKDVSSTLKQYRPETANGTKTILLVDDEDMIWDVLSDMLQELGYRVILAGDGQEAVQIYGSNPGRIDLVILDMLMPNMGGRETFFILKELDPNVKVLASSGYVSQEEIQDVMDSGAVGFMRKPYRMADLAKKIQEIFQD